MIYHTLTFRCILTTLLCLMATFVLAGAKEDMAEMQKRLNAETMERPFDPGEASKIEAQLDAALAKGIKPPGTPSVNWRPGYTCRDMWRYSRQEYYNCQWYYRYHGRYY